MAHPDSPSTRPLVAEPNRITAFVERHVKGYPMLAYMMGMAPQAAHLRRFSVISMRVLLLMQNEIHHLETLLLKSENNEDIPADPRMSPDIDGGLSSDSSPSRDEREYEILVELKIKIKEYGEIISVWRDEEEILTKPGVEEALIRFRELSDCRRDKSMIEEIQFWLDDPEHCYRHLPGDAADMWGSSQDPDAFMPDLFQLCPSANESMFQTYFKRLIRHGISKKDVDGIVAYRTDVMESLVSCVAFSVTSAILYVAIYYVKQAKTSSAQLLRVIIFIALTSASFVFFRSPQFTFATTGVAAVLVTLLPDTH